jgi:hypothetical protein
MSTATVPLATLGALYRPPHLRRARATPPPRRRSGNGRLLLWTGAIAAIALLYLVTYIDWNWKHTIASSGGRYFVQRVLIPVPAFSQEDPRWSLDPLGPTVETLGQSGCAITSAAMVLSAYGVDTDPHRLNQYLTTHNGYTPQGWVYWEKAAELAGGQLEKAYEDRPSYALIDQNLLAGNPVIVRLTLPNGTPHFVVLVGKQGWDYLTQDPARGPNSAVYPLKDLTDHIEGLRFYRLISPHFTL